MISQRLPVVATQVSHTSRWTRGATGCFGELQEAADRLDHKGFVSRPEWTALRDGARPPQEDASELGEWQDGWRGVARLSQQLRIPAPAHDFPRVDVWEDERCMSTFRTVEEQSCTYRTHFGLSVSRSRCCCAVQRRLGTLSSKLG